MCIPQVRQLPTEKLVDQLVCKIVRILSWRLLDALGHFLPSPPIAGMPIHSVWSNALEEEIGPLSANPLERSQRFHSLAKA